MCGKIVHFFYFVWLLPVPDGKETSQGYTDIVKHFTSNFSTRISVLLGKKTDGIYTYSKHMESPSVPLYEMNL